MQTITTYFTDNNLPHILANKLTIEEHFIEQEHFTITYTSSRPLYLLQLYPTHPQNPDHPMTSQQNLDTTIIKEMYTFGTLFQIEDQETYFLVLFVLLKKKDY